MAVFSDVEFTKTDLPHPKMLAEGTFVVGNAMKVKFILFDGKNGPFPMLPSREYKKKDGGRGFDRQIETLSRELSEELSEVILEAYNDQVKNVSVDENPEDSSDSQEEIPF